MRNRIELGEKCFLTLTENLLFHSMGLLGISQPLYLLNTLNRFSMDSVKCKVSAKKMSSTVNIMSESLKAYLISLTLLGLA